MYFKEAFRLMKKGEKVKRKMWGGYWEWLPEKDTIMIHCRDGSSFDIRETDNMTYTMNNIVCGDWIVATSENCPLLGGKIAGLSFEEAANMAKKHNVKIRRKEWAEGDYIIYRRVDPDPDSDFLYKKPYSMFSVWTPARGDLFSHDWEVISEYV